MSTDDDTHPEGHAALRRRPHRPRFRRRGAGAAARGDRLRHPQLHQGHAGEGASSKRFAERYGVPHCARRHLRHGRRPRRGRRDRSRSRATRSSPRRSPTWAAIAPILYQGAIPIFADVDPLTSTSRPRRSRRSITPRTRAIIVTHLFGNPCDMDPIMALATAHGIPVIEDCAQAFLATYDGQPRRHDRRDRLPSACSRAST